MMSPTSRATISVAFFSAAAWAASTTRWRASGAGLVKRRASETSSILSVEPPGPDHRYDGRRDQPVDRQTGTEASSQLGGGNVQTGDRDHFAPPSLPRRSGVRVPGALHHHDGR